MYQSISPYAGAPCLLGTSPNAVAPSLHVPVLMQVPQSLHVSHLCLGLCLLWKARCIIIVPCSKTSLLVNKKITFVHHSSFLTMDSLVCHTWLSSSYLTMNCLVYYTLVVLVISNYGQSSVSYLPVLFISNYGQSSVSYLPVLFISNYGQSSVS